MQGSAVPTVSDTHDFNFNECLCTTGRKSPKLWLY